MNNAPEPALINPLWNDYLALAGVNDEIHAESGAVRPCWERFMEQAGGISAPWYARLQKMANRQLRDHGVTFHLHAGDEKDVHPWKLDPIPLIIGDDEWRHIDDGLRQRARLLSLVLSDIYGPQDLIRKGLIPQDLILRHRGYLRPRSNNMPQGPFTLFNYTADLARGPGGKMWVLNDHTGVHSGAGYALENRTIMARLFPEEIRRLQVHRLSGSFRAMRSGLRAIAPKGDGQPRVVFYTPGPYSPAYFEHAFLASYLGYTLVQGDDLLVRGGRVWLKALEGLQPVDVIIRRVGDSFCDPLELDQSSELGIPGLLEAVRHGRVAVVNEVGSQVLENPGLMPFLPALSRTLLGEELILPTAATWWCGQEKEKQHVLAKLDSLVIKTTDRQPVEHNGGLGPYTPAQRAKLMHDIEKEPWRYIGQERVSFSTAPVLEDDHIAPRVVALRTMVNFDGSSYQVMPGGFARCGDAGQTYLPSEQVGGICKDVWVLAPEPVAFNSLWLERQGDGQGGPLSGFFTSSAVENLFWTGRYAERAHGLIQSIRILLQIYDQSLVSGTDARARCLQKIWEGFLLQTGKVPDPEEKKEVKAPTLGDLAPYILDARIQGGLGMALNGFVNAAFSVRENWAKDTWRIINRVQELNSDELADPTLGELGDRLDNLLLLLEAFFGQCAGNMTRTAGWLFLEIGRRIEHGTMMIDLLVGAMDSAVDELTEYYLLEALLEVNESLITYRRAYRTTPTLPDVLDLLIKQSKSPKSLSFQLSELEHRLGALGQEIQQDAVNHLVSVVAGGRRLLRVKEPKILGRPDAEGRYPELIDALQEVRNDILFQAASALSNACFKHAMERPRPLTVSRHHMHGERVE